MRLPAGRAVAGAQLLVAALLAAIPAAAETPLLERYVLDSLRAGRGPAYELTDQSLGGGDAHSQLRYRRGSGGGTLTLRVWRRVPRGNASFALLGERIEVRGYDFEGTVVYSRDFVGLQQEGFLFGDSQSGDWRRTLRSIPASVRKLEVAFFGNYE